MIIIKRFSDCFYTNSWSKNLDYPGSKMARIRLSRVKKKMAKIWIIQGQILQKSGFRNLDCLGSDMASKFVSSYKERR